MVYVLFFLSGVAALLYQVVWTQELANQFGVTAQRFTTPTSLEPDNLYYRYAEGRGVYGLARARQHRIHRGKDDGAARPFGLTS